MIAKDVIERAMQIMGVKASGEEIEPHDALDGLAVLAALLAEWRGSEIPVTDYGVSSLHETLSIPLAHKEAVAGKLAERMAGDYGVELTSVQLKNIEEAFNRMQLAYFVATPADYRHMPGVSIYAK